jgi:pimeloyl-ACP methyl ester carboxylesterase
VRAAMLAVALGAASATYQQVAEVRDRRRFPPPGRMVDIGGRCLHLVDGGEGGPAVVIIPGLADNVLQWLPVVRQLQGQTRICVYDRAGIGWSDPPQHGKGTIDGMAVDLHDMLTAAGIQPPYILAGHSLGGIIARRFATRYPASVTGLLLIDSVHEDQIRRFHWEARRPIGRLTKERTVRGQAQILGLRRLAATFGLLRGLDAEIAREAPPEFAGAARAIALSASQQRVVEREFCLAVRLKGEPAPLGSLPLTVVTADRPWPESAPWARMQAELAGLSSSSRHVSTQRAGHHIHLDEPELIIEAVRNLVSRAVDKPACSPGTAIRGRGAGTLRLASARSLSAVPVRRGGNERGLGTHDNVLATIEMTYGLPRVSRSAPAALITGVRVS